MRRNIL